LSRKWDFRCITTSEELGQALTALRLSHNMTAAEVARKSGIHKSSVSRIERGKFDFETIDVSQLRRYLASVNENRTSCYCGWHFFKLLHRRILEDYLADKGITKSELGPSVGVSKQLGITWVNMESRYPSMELWEREFKEYSAKWAEKNDDLTP